MIDRAAVLSNGFDGRPKEVYTWDECIAQPLQWAMVNINSFVFAAIGKSRLHALTIASRTEVPRLASRVHQITRSKFWQHSLTLAAIAIEKYDPDFFFFNGYLTKSAAAQQASDAGFPEDQASQLAESMWGSQAGTW
jgi:hypothetical protein